MIFLIKNGIDFHPHMPQSSKDSEYYTPSKSLIVRLTSPPRLVLLELVQGVGREDKHIL